MSVTRFNSPLEGQYEQTYVSQFVPMPFEFMQKATESRQAKYDAVQGGLENLKKETSKRIHETDTQLNHDFLNNINKKVNNAIDEVGGDLSRLGQFVQSAKAEVASFYTDGPGAISLMQVEKDKQHKEKLDKLKMDEIDKQGAIEMQQILYGVNNGAVGGQTIDGDYYYNYDQSENVNKAITQANALKESGYSDWSAEITKILGDESGEYLKQGSIKTKGVNAGRVSSLMNTMIYQDSSWAEKIQQQYRLRRDMGKVQGDDSFINSLKERAVMRDSQGKVMHDANGNVMLNTNVSESELFQIYKDTEYTKIVRGAIQAIPHSEVDKSYSVSETAASDRSKKKKEDEQVYAAAVTVPLHIKNSEYNQSIVDNPDEAVLLASTKYGVETNNIVKNFLTTALVESHEMNANGLKTALDSAALAWSKVTNGNFPTTEMNLNSLYQAYSQGDPTATKILNDRLKLGNNEQGSLKQTVRNANSAELVKNYSITKAVQDAGVISALSPEMMKVYNKRLQTYEQTLLGNRKNAKAGDRIMYAKAGTPEHALLWRTDPEYAFVHDAITNQTNNDLFQNSLENAYAIKAKKINDKEKQIKTETDPKKREQYYKEIKAFERYRFYGGRELYVSDLQNKYKDIGRVVGKNLSEQMENNKYDVTQVMATNYIPVTGKDGKLDMTAGAKALKGVQNIYASDIDIFLNSLVYSTQENEDGKTVRELLKEQNPGVSTEEITKIAKGIISPASGVNGIQFIYGKRNGNYLFKVGDLVFESNSKSVNSVTTSALDNLQPQEKAKLNAQNDVTEALQHNGIYYSPDAGYKLLVDAKGNKLPDASDYVLEIGTDSWRGQDANAKLIEINKMKIIGETNAKDITSPNRYKPYLSTDGKYYSTLKEAINASINK